MESFSLFTKSLMRFRFLGGYLNSRVAALHFYLLVCIALCAASIFNICFTSFLCRWIRDTSIFIPLDPNLTSCLWSTWKIISFILLLFSTYAVHIIHLLQFFPNVVSAIFFTVQHLGPSHSLDSANSNCWFSNLTQPLCLYKWQPFLYFLI